MRRASIPIAAAIILLAAMPANFACAQFRDLVRRVPTDANALVMINVTKVLDSRLAKLEGWQLKQEKSFDSGMVILPPEAKRFVLASKVNFEYFDPTYEVMIIQVNEIPSMLTVAKRRGGQADRIVGMPACLLPTDTFLVKFDYDIIAARSPSNRQDVSKWARDSAARSEAQVSPYLTEALGYSDKVGTEIIMAMDLTHVLSANFAKSRLLKCETLKDRQVDCEALARAVASIRGLTLGVVIRDKPTGSLKVDFGEDVSMMNGFAKELLLEALGGAGLMIDDFKDWKAEVHRTQVRLNGELTSSGLRRIFSVFHAQQSTLGAHQSQQDQGPPDKATAALNYFRSVKGLYEDIRGKRGNPNTKTTGQIAIWYGKYAQKIDDLPILNVDPDLLSWGRYVSGSLRACENGMRGIGTQSSLRSSQLPNYYNVQSWGGVRAGRWGRWGAVGGWSATEDLSAKGQAQARIRTEERITGHQSVIEKMQEIEAETQKVRVLMTDRYKVEFQ